MTTIPGASNGQVKDALHEGNGQRVFPMAGIVALPIEIVERLVLDGDVRRVADDGVVLLAEDAVEFLGVLDLEVVGGFVFEGRVVAAEHVVLGDDVGFSLGIEAGPVDEGIAGGEVHLEVRGAAELANAAVAPGGEQQPEAGDGGGEGIDVHAVNAGQREHGAFLVAKIRAFLFPQREQAPEAAEQEVPGAAGGIDHPHDLEAEGVDRRIERAVENELLDEVRRLEQGELLARGLGEVLVEIAEESRVRDI
jgi:hypothetical protein